jgi:basic amino acid/polyamine antiporter, APA family
LLRTLLKKKPLELATSPETESGLKRTLGAFDLTVLGVGAIIGAGIFVIAGKGAQVAGPGIMLSFVLVAIACLCSALCYAEMAAMIPTSGSAYAYAYHTLGEIVAWMIGWLLVLEYTVASAAVAAGWSGYFSKILHNIGVMIPDALTKTPFEGGMINLPSFLIALFVMSTLIFGVKESARLNAAFVLIKSAVLLVFLLVATPHINPANWTPFMPMGINGVIAGGALIFFAYIGFDAVATTAEEAKNPQRDLPIGIVLSLIICTIFYIAVAAAMTGVVPYTVLNDAAPLAKALTSIHEEKWAVLISVGAIFGLSSVLVVLMMGMPRIWMAMSRDGLLPKLFSTIHPKYHTPYIATIINGVAVAVLTGFLPLDKIAEMTNIGTLTAFAVVAIGVWVLRFTEPNLVRGFKAPWLPLICPIAVISCGAMMLNLKAETWLYFVIWSVLGILVYTFYGFKNSQLQKKN